MTTFVVYVADGNNYNIKHNSDDVIQFRSSILQGNYNLVELKDDGGNPLLINRNQICAVEVLKHAASDD
jgi:hypothetical protein